MKTTSFLKLLGPKLAATLLILVLFSFGCADEESTATPTTSIAEPTATKPPATPTATSISIIPSTILGRPNSPIEIVVYSDFKCGACEKLHSGAEAELIRVYVETGKARLEVRHLPALGADSMRSAQAALCAGDQGQFWEYRDAIYSAWRKTGNTAYSSEELRMTANELGFNEAAFNACLDSEAKRAEVEENRRQAKVYGVRRVPTMFINGRKVEGNKPFETYVKIIEELLVK